MSYRFGDVISVNFPQSAGDQALVDWSHAGLIKPSWVRLAKVFFALKSDVGKKYGRLSDSDRTTVGKAWASLYGSFVS